MFWALYLPANANHKFYVSLADVNFRAHCGIAIRAVSENRDPFQSRGKDTKLAENNEWEKGQNVPFISLVYINCHSSIGIGASCNSLAYFPVFSSFRNCRNCWKAQMCLETHKYCQDFFSGLDIMTCNGVANTNSFLHCTSVAM